MLMPNGGDEDGEDVAHVDYGFCVPVDVEIEGVKTGADAAVVHAIDGGVDAQKGVELEGSIGGAMLHGFDDGDVKGSVGSVVIT